MSDKKPFSDRRWTDIPKGVTVGHTKVSKAERLEARKHIVSELLKNKTITEEEAQRAIKEIEDLEE